MATVIQPTRLQPSAEQLLARLEKDIAWLKARGLWSRSLFERGVRRYLAACEAGEAGVSAEPAQQSRPNLDDFMRRHLPSSVTSSGRAL